MSKMDHPYVHFSNPIKPGELDAAYSVGMLRKNQLQDGHYYRGYCRNAEVARWSEANQKFYYMRTKFRDRFVDDINHPEDDNGFDLFICFEETTPTPLEEIKDEVLAKE